MKWLPLHNFEIRSPLSAETALGRISAHVEPVKFFRFQLVIGFWVIHGAGPDQFEGYVAGDSFDLRRLLNYTNSFAPRTIGKVHSFGSESLVKIRMMLPEWLIPLAAAIAVILAAVSISSGAPLVSDFNIAAIFVGVLYVVMMAGFWFEARHQENSFRRMFEEVAPIAPD